MAFRTFKRKLEWWREEGEVPSEKRLTEDYTGLKAGSDGRNVPSVITKYAKKSNAGFGTPGVNASKSTGVAEKVLKHKARVQEDFPIEDEEEEFDPAQAELSDDGMDDLPPDLENPEEMMDDEGGETDEATNIIVTIDDQDYGLTPMESSDDEGMDDEEMPDEGMDDEEMPDEGMDDEERPDEGMDDEDEEPRFESKENLDRIRTIREKIEGLKKAKIIEKIRSSRKASIIEKIIKAKEERSTLGGKKLVISKGVEPGTVNGNYGAIPHTQGGSKVPAYKPSKSTGPYENKKESKEFIEALAKIRARRAVKEAEGAIDCELPVEAIEDFANISFEKGGDPTTISNSSVAKRIEKIRARRASLTESTEVPSDKLDFKKLMENGYTSKK